MNKQNGLYKYNDSTLKMKEILIHATTWMNLGNIMLREISHTQKDKYCVIPYMRYLEEEKL